MAKPNEKLAESLTALKTVQAGGRRVFRSQELSRTHRERLIRNGFLREVVKGWVMSSSPSANAGDSTPWYASFWEFCASYCNERFGESWHLSPEQSLLLHAENTVIPTQVVVYSPKGANHSMSLPFDTSLYDLKQSSMPPQIDLSTKAGLKLFSPASALVKVPEPFFARNPIETRVVLTGIQDATDVLRLLLNGGHSAKAGHLAGAFRRIGRADIADEIVKTMKSAEYDVRESDPFAGEHLFGVLDTGTAPIVGRLQAMWEAMRGEVLAVLPDAPGLPRDSTAYLHAVDDMYQSDAYHSLSIEGYNVTPALIERVQQGNWNPQANNEDRQSHDALAARGYWQAFGKVKQTIEQGALRRQRRKAGPNGAPRVVSRTLPAMCRRRPHRSWRVGRLQERCRLPANLTIRPPTMGSGTRRNACAVRSAGERASAECAGCPRSLDVWLHPPLSRRERPHGAFPNERYVGIRRLSLDSDSC